MKLTVLFLVTSGIILHLNFGEPKQSLVPRAIHQVIEQHYVKNSVKFEIIFNSNDSEVVKKTLKLIKELKDYRITKVNDEDKTRFGLQHSGIFIFDSYENYKTFEVRLLEVINGPKEMNLLIFCADFPTKHRQFDLPTDLPQLRSFLVEENNGIVLKSLTLFTPLACRTLHLLEINKFTRKSMQWKETTFFRTSIRDFHGCPLYFGVPTLPSVEKLPNGTYNVQGTAVDLFNALSSHLNYRVEQVWINTEKLSHEIDHNYFSIFYIDEQIFYEFDVSTPLFTSAVVIVVPPGEPYSPIEKFFLPFDLQTWIWFSIVFVVAFSVTVAVKLSRSRALRIFVVGENVSSPGLNIFGIFMGIGMLSLPPRIVSRFLLMNFILFSLIMRTAFQGKYFEFMTKDIHKKEIQTVEQLIEKNFTLYVKITDVSWNEMLERTPYFSSLQRLNYQEYSRSEMQDKLRNDLQNGSFKGCAIDVSQTWKEAENESLQFRFLQKKVITLNWSIAFERGAFFSPIFRAKIEQLVTAGMYDEWSRIHSERRKNFRKKQPKPYDTVLTMEHLSIGFYIWILMCLLSTSAFALELLIYWGPKVSRMLFFHYILCKFYKMQKSKH